MDIAVTRLMTLRVKDVMTRRVICVGEDQNMSEAAGLFLEKGISGAPVVDAEGCCVGMLSAFDYVRRAHFTQTAPDPGALTDTLLAAARLMCEKHVHRLPVLDLDNKLVGLITAMDVVAALVNAMDERDALMQ